MSRLTPRTGAGLPEMIVALSLAAIVSVAGATALLGAERYARVASAASSARRTLREAEAVLASDLRASAADSIRVRGDTALDFTSLVGVSVTCAVSGKSIVLPPDAASGGYPYTAWRASPEAGDILAVFDTANGGTWRTATVDSAASRADGAGCTPETGLLSPADSAARRTATRLVLRVSLGALDIGSPVRIARPARYALTHSADGTWSLSYRRCDGGSCGVAQPVAGPLTGGSGLLFTAAAGAPELVARLRALPAGRQVFSDTIHIALRNRGTGAPWWAP